MAKRHFKNLDGLRFIAAASVAVSHLETLKQYRHIPFIHNRFIENSAQIAVTFFFVLSGFLIMWWFLEETGGDTTKISPRAFYSNRIARTWPLYFLVVILSICISFINGTFANDVLASKRYIAYLLFLPNTADVFFGKDIYMSPAWSLAVEEFFYLFFPLLLLKIRKEKLLQTLLMLAAVFILVSTLANRILLNFFSVHFTFDTTVDIITTFFERYRFYSFFLGAVAAVLIFYNRVPAVFCERNNFHVLLTLLMVLLFFNGVTFSFLTQQVYSLLFAGFILAMAGSNTQFGLLNNRYIIWGGKISYGIYMLHMFVILRLINQGIFLLQVNSNALSIFISWVVYLTLVLSAAHFSYKLFENPIRSAARKWLFAKTKKTGT